MPGRVDWVVIGGGVMGLAAAHALAGSGTVLVLERVGFGHTGGSSHGESRVIRIENFENPGGYAPWIRRAVAGWTALEDRPGEIYVRAGVIEGGPPGGAVVSGAVQPGEVIREGLDTDAQARLDRALSVLDLPRDWGVTFQPDGGLIRADVAIRRYVQRLRAHPGVGLRLAGAASVRQRKGGGVEITLDTGERIEAAVAVVATGPWIADLVPALAGRVKVTRQVLAWFDSARPEIVREGRLPVFAFDLGDAQVVYGFPHADGFGIKAGFHVHGPAVTPGDAVAPPDEAGEIEPLRAALQALVGPLTVRAHTTCLYTNTADEEFVVDRDPERPDVIVVSACSGHGFKFAPAIGAYAASIAQGAGFRLDRPGLAAIG